MVSTVQVMITDARPGARADRAAAALRALASVDEEEARRHVEAVLRGGVACVPLPAGPGADELLQAIVDSGLTARICPFGGPTSPDLLPPEALREGSPDPAAVVALLTSFGHADPEKWFAARGPFPSGTAVWRELLRDECDKLYNQAWCAFDQIRSAEDPDSVMFLAMDDFPSAVEQAFALAPPLASEHLALLREYREDRLDSFLRELGAGTAREAHERAEALAFWEDNAEAISDLRRNLFRLVRGAL